MHHHLYLFILCLVLPLSYGELLTYAHVKGSPYTVSYTSRAFLINGSPTVLLSGSVHYVRSTPAMWPGIFDLAVKNGLNTIETYVFWNYHEAERGVYDFTGRGDLLQFIQQAAEHNLFVTLRIGPYVCAEWDYGGFPLWLRDIPGIQFRTYNKPFMNEMANFVQLIVEMVRPYFASQGGNIILAQIENEYNGGPTEGNGYIAWCGELAASLDVGVPWIMCNGQYANNTIETCNACECDSWVATHWKEQPNTPPAWTENEGWFDQFGMAAQVRAASNLAYSVARYFAVGGAHMNYYMWHGGNNYGITGAATMTTRYANDVILDSMALPHEPKFSFSTSLHLLIAQYFRTMINYPPTPKNLTTTGVDIVDYNVISFISNTNESFAETVTVSGATLSIPPQTVIAIDNSNPPNILFNTSNVLNGTIPHTITESSGNFVWTAYTEPVGITLNNVIRNPTPFEHLVISQDKTDYVWYSAELTLANVGDFRAVSIMAHAYSLYFNGKFENVGWDVTKSCCDHINITVPVGDQITAGTYQVDILSTSLGIENGGDNMELFKKGIVGDVFIGDTNVTLPPNNGWWTMQSGLVGEALEIYQPYNLDLVNWTSTITANTPITWYTTTFPTPILPGTVAIDATGLGKGHLYLNGNALGRYWLLPGSCSDITCCCYYFDSNSNCTLPTQYLYHVPPDWLNTIGPNVLTIFEELGAPDISTVKVVVVS